MIVEYEIFFYENEKGISEIYDYIQKISVSNQKQDVRIFKKLVHQMELLRMLGTDLHEPQAKFLRGLKLPLWELRPMPERLFYGTWQHNKFIFLSHYVKKTNKTDKKGTVPCQVYTLNNKN